MHRLFLGLGFWLAGLAVAAGAFGTHALDGAISASRLETFETAARYQLAQALGLIGMALAAARWPARSWRGPGYLMLSGTVIFSGSLYALALSGMGWLGAITPIGGALSIISWAWAGWTAFRET